MEMQNDTANPGRAHHRSGASDPVRKGDAPDQLGPLGGLRVSSVICRYRDEVDRGPYHFAVSGLQNVYLLSGYELHETKEGPAVSFADTDGLSRALGRYLAYQRRRLTGKEWLF